MSFKALVWLLILVLVIYVGWKSVIILDEDEQMLVTQMGHLIQEPDTAAGFHLITPLISQAYVYKKNLIEWHSEVAEMPTRDDKFVAIESFAYWKISDPVSFYQSVKTIETAEKRLTDLLDGMLRDEIARYSLAELVRSSNRRMDTSGIQNVLKVPQKKTLFQVKGQQPKINAAIFNNASTALDSLRIGIRLVDFNLKTVNYIQTIE